MIIPNTDWSNKVYHCSQLVVLRNYSVLTLNLHFISNFKYVFLFIFVQEELDTKVLKFQNAKIYAKLEEKNAMLEELNSKISELDRLRANDQTIISTLNVAWNQVNISFLCSHFISLQWS